MANIVLMPMLGMRMFAEEEKQGTLEMMLTLTGSLWSFVSKNLSGLLSTMVLFCSLLCTGVLAWLGNPDWGYCICLNRPGTVLGLFIVCVGIRICFNQGTDCGRLVGCIAFVAFLDGGLSGSNGRNPMDSSALRRLVSHASFDTTEQRCGRFVRCILVCCRRRVLLVGD